MSTKTIEVAREDVRPGDTVSLTKNGRTVTGPAAECPGGIHIRWQDDRTAGACTDDGWAFFTALREVPEWKPGTVGTATVRGVEGVRVMRTDGGVAPKVEEEWFSAIGIPMDTNSTYYYHPDAVVTDFVPDDAEALRARVAELEAEAEEARNEAEADAANIRGLSARVQRITRERDDARQLAKDRLDGMHANGGVIRKVAAILSVDPTDDDAILAAVRLRAARTAPENPTLRIENGWLVQVVNSCTCAGVDQCGLEAHENGCGLEPLQRLDNLPGWPAARTLPTRERVTESLAGHMTMTVTDMYRCACHAPLAPSVDPHMAEQAHLTHVAEIVLALFEQGGAAPKVLEVTEEQAVEAIKARLAWPSLHWGAESLHPDALPHIANAVRSLYTGRSL